MGSTSIQWTDATWNPTTGCREVSPGCAHCYARTLFPRVYGKRPFHDVQFHPERLDAPLRWRKPRRVFVNSMSDLFHESLDYRQIYAVFDVMARAQRHTFQILTKRPERMLDFCSRVQFIRTEDLAHLEEPGLSLSPARIGNHVPLPNVWLGVSVEDQATADARIPLLLQTPAAVRFVSYEPALGPVDFGVALSPQRRKCSCHGGMGAYSMVSQGLNHLEDCDALNTHRKLDWLIVGGESGPGARPFDLAWARSAIEQCKAAGVPLFMKQVGRYPIVGSGMEGGPIFSNAEDRRGGDMSMWPDDLRVRDFPGARP